MNRNTFLLVCMLLCSIGGIAQEKKTEEVKKGFYMRAGLGYAMANGGSVQGALYSYSVTSQYPLNGSLTSSRLATNQFTTYDLKKVSYTSGIQGTLALGYNLTDHIAVELNANVGIVTNETKSDVKIIENAQTTATFSVTQQANNPLFLTPSIVVQSGGKINVYARGGVALPVLTEMSQKLVYNLETYNPQDSSFVQRDVTITETYKMRFTPGFSGATGVQFKAGNNVTMWAEVGLLSVNLYYKKSDITSYDQDGVSVLNQIPPSQRTTTYDFKGTVNTSGNNYPTIQVPFSNFNISVGVKLDLK